MKEKTCQNHVLGLLWPKQKCQAHLKPGSSKWLLQLCSDFSTFSLPFIHKPKTPCSQQFDIQQRRSGQVLSWKCNTAEQRRLISSKQAICYIYCTPSIRRLTWCEAAERLPWRNPEVFWINDMRSFQTMIMWLWNSSDCVLSNNILTQTVYCKTIRLWQRAAGLSRHNTSTM